MSDREFENYLQLLRGLLQLNRDQSESISAELRSHMEDRLEELLAQGISREEAIQQALAEFGDAAGLGNKFGAISLTRKRRWLMRLMTFSTAATLLIAASLITFWPGRNAAPGLAIAAAQVPAGAGSFVATGTPPADEPSLQEKLNQRIDFNVVEMPLNHVVLLLQKDTGIQIVLSLKKLDEASVSGDTPITKSLQRVRVSTLLDLLLADLELTYLEKDDLLVITTPVDAESNLKTRVYDCRDLLAMPAPEVPIPRVPISGPAITTIIPPIASPNTAKSPSENEGGVDGSPGTTSSATPNNGRTSGGGMPYATPKQRPTHTELEKRTDQLIELITATVKPDSWDDVGGPGAIDAYNGLFVVSQTTKVHSEVEHVLDMLRQAAGLEVPKMGKVVR